MKVENLRKKYNKFVYNSYSYKVSKKNLEIFFDFRVEEDLSSSSPFAATRVVEPGISFKPRIVIENIDSNKFKKIGESVLNNLIFQLGLIEMLSYWKTTCSKEIEIRAGSLDNYQVKWWKDLIINGMGQFFYENKINWKIINSLKILSTRAVAKDEEEDLSSLTSKKTNFNVFKRNLSNKILLPIGGGKDSIVSLELLKKQSKNITCFSLNPTNAAKAVMNIANRNKPIIVKRKIDTKLLELNRKGFLNGHTPFSAYLAFLTVLIGVIFDYKYIALSNERSSNEGNFKYLGNTINHQYSKTFDFEKKFRNYSKKYLAEDIEYFSFLRPLYEIQIGKLFSKYFDKYGKAFLSCNEAHKTYSGRTSPIKKWCCQCPKCLFVFAILYPFIETKKLVEVFGKNLFKSKQLVGLMKELIGESKFKPFECVGTKKESLVAFYLSLKKAKKEKNKLPYLLKYFEKYTLTKHSKLKRESKNIMNSWNKQHFLSKRFIKYLKT